MKISKFQIIVPALIVIVALAYLLMQQPVPSKVSYSHFSVGNRSFAITYVASNYSQWTEGLMNKTVTNSTFELFVFPNPSIYPFWMNNTYTNLDMLWVNGSSHGGKVVYILKNAPSCLKANCPIYTPTALANYVIEARAGFAMTNNVTVGRYITFG